VVLKEMKRSWRGQDVSGGYRGVGEFEELPLNYFAFFSAKGLVVL
jgi:hypothetical protein